MIYSDTLGLLKKSTKVSDGWRTPSHHKVVQWVPIMVPIMGLHINMNVTEQCGI